ncbi:hypothetical protein IE53DRAFT_129253 [Violaceomyces palustris]|uniref:Uncharacterized protein n=1 Tax=Violaceomyces palustris TaxID=1673888 RepID=A0ACD0NVD6_9BASI|nr:hypothetical protein IE53DRAFT_129253 [Violaceomyces palustris]
MPLVAYPLQSIQSPETQGWTKRSCNPNVESCGGMHKGTWIAIIIIVVVGIVVLVFSLFFVRYFFKTKKQLGQDEEYEGDLYYRQDREEEMRQVGGRRDLDVDVSSRYADPGRTHHGGNATKEVERRESAKIQESRNTSVSTNGSSTSSSSSSTSYALGRPAVAVAHLDSEPQREGSATQVGRAAMPPRGYTNGWGRGMESPFTSSDKTQIQVEVEIAEGDVSEDGAQHKSKKVKAKASRGARTRGERDLELSPSLSMAETVQGNDVDEKKDGSKAHKDGVPDVGDDADMTRPTSIPYLSYQRDRANGGERGSSRPGSGSSTVQSCYSTTTSTSSCSHLTATAKTNERSSRSVKPTKTASKSSSYRASHQDHDTRSKNSIAPTTTTVAKPPKAATSIGTTTTSPYPSSTTSSSSTHAPSKNRTNKQRDSMSSSSIRSNGRKTSTMTGSTETYTSMAWPAALIMAGARPLNSSSSSSSNSNPAPR